MYNSVERTLTWIDIDLKEDIDISESVRCLTDVDSGVCSLKVSDSKRAVRQSESTPSQVYRLRVLLPLDDWLRIGLNGTHQTETFA